MMIRATKFEYDKHIAYHALSTALSVIWSGNRKNELFERHAYSKNKQKKSVELCRFCYEYLVANLSLHLSTIGLVSSDEI